MRFPRFLPLASVIASLSTLGMPVISSTGALVATAIAFSAAAPHAQAIAPHKKGGKPHGGGKPHHKAPAKPHGKPHHGPSHAKPRPPAHVHHPAPHHHPAPPHRGPAPRRVAHHGYHALPRGAVPYTYGGRRYYRLGSRFFYPYFYGGRTVYIDIDAPGGVPGPPPVAGSISINF